MQKLNLKPALNWCSLNTQVRNGKMKRKTPIIPVMIALAFGVVGCSDNKTSDAKPLPEEIKIQNSRPVSLKPDLVPDGHWLTNSSFCRKLLPSQGVYDFKILQNSFTKIGITQEGQWVELHDQNFKKEVLQFLNSETVSCANFELSKLLFARYAASGLEIDFAYVPGEKFILTKQQGVLDLAVEFDIDILKTFEFIQVDSETGTPDPADEVEPSITEQPI